jgi:hypothetical protein
VTTLYSHRVEVYTHALTISGWYDMSIYRRVSDALNGEQRRYLPLRDASVTPLEHPSAVQRVPTLLVDRGEMVIVATLEEAPPPPGYERDDLMHTRKPRTAMFFTNNLVVRATVHTRTDLDMLEQLERVEEEFIRLSRVQIYPIRGGQAFSREFAALRRESIAALYVIGDGPLVAPTPPLPLEESLPPPPPSLPDENGEVQPPPAAPLAADEQNPDAPAER